MVARSESIHLVLPGCKLSILYMFIFAMLVNISSSFNVLRPLMTATKNFGGYNYNSFISRKYQLYGIPDTFGSTKLSIADLKREGTADLKERKIQRSEDPKEKPNPASVWGPRGVLLFVSALYGTNFGCVKLLGESLDPSVAACARFSVAALVFSPFLFKQFKNPGVLIAGAEVGLYAFIGYLAQAIALQTTSASSAAFICSLAVIVVPILDMLFDKSKNQGEWYSTLLPALLAATGVGCLELGGVVVPGFGDLLCFLQPLFFGLCFWRTERHSRKYAEPAETKAFTGAMMLAVAVLSLGWSSIDVFLPAIRSTDGSMTAFIQSQFTAFYDWKVILSILWTGIVTTALTSYGENVAMVQLSAAESTVIYSTEPLWGTLFAVLALHEHVGWNTLIGAILILSACLWSSLGPTLSVAGLVSSVQMGEKFPEIYENIVMNWQKMFDSFENMSP